MGAFIVTNFNDAKCVCQHLKESIEVFQFCCIYLPFDLVLVQAKDQEGRTPLHYAAALHDSGIFYRYLLKCGADELIQDKYGKTAKHYVYAPQDIDLNSLVRRCQEMPR